MSHVWNPEWDAVKGDWSEENWRCWIEYGDPYTEDPANPGRIRWTWDQVRRNEDLGDPSAAYPADDPRRFGLYGYGTSGWTWGPLYSDDGHQVSVQNAITMTRHPDVMELILTDEIRRIGENQERIPYRADCFWSPPRWRRESLG